MTSVGRNISYFTISDIPWDCNVSADLAPLQALVSETRSVLYVQTC